MKCEPVSREMIVEDGGICVSKLEHGIDKFQHLILSGTEKELELFIERAAEWNGLDHSYFDFYYTVLEESDRCNFFESIQETDRKILEYFDLEHKDVYYRLDKRVLPFVAGVTAREQLFSTFYFTAFPCMIWGNYGLSYPVFFGDEAVKEKYVELAVQCGCNFEEMVGL